MDVWADFVLPVFTGIVAPFAMICGIVALADLFFKVSE